MFKKVLWTALVTGLTSLSAALAFRLARGIWIAAALEEPPKPPFWAKLIVGKPMKGKIKGSLQAPV